jgi:hypothetical protein
MIRFTALILGSVIAIVPTAMRAAPSAAARERLSFNGDWRFAQGDLAGSEGKLDYQMLKPWLLATGPEFSVNSPSAARPTGNPGAEAGASSTSLMTGESKDLSNRNIPARRASSPGGESPGIASTSRCRLRIAANKSTSTWTAPWLTRAFG